MESPGYQPCVLGTGRLAAAVRIELRLTRLFAGASEHSPALFLACSDFENAALCPALAERVRQDRATVLFACLTHEALRVGPLVSPGASETLFTHFSTHNRAFGPADTLHRSSSNDPLTPNADTAPTRVAQIGASLVVGELAKFFFGEEADRRLVRCVTENDSPSLADAVNPHATTVDRALHDVTLVTSRAPNCHAWNRISHLWHPAEI